MFRFFAPDARDGAATVVLSDGEAHHLTHVLRLGPGSDVHVFDGAGREWTGRVAEADQSTVTIALGARVPAVEEPAVRVVLAVGLLKGDQMDAVVRDATAMGVRAIAPLETDHVAVHDRRRRDARATERYRRVAIAAAKQSGRAVVPAILPTATLQATLDDSDCEASIIGVEPAHDRSRAPATPIARPASALLLVGPEGGWSKAEVDFAIARGARPLSLGPRTLRAETTPVVLIATLWAWWLTDS